MVRVKLDLRKTVEQNAAVYYEKAKKAKKKIEGAQRALEDARNKLAAVQKEKEKELVKIEKEEKEKQKLRERKKQWYEKFRWFVSSNGFLCVGGRDATTNDIIVKKYCEKGDLVFHTDIPGSPFFVIKAEGKKIDDKTKQEVAQATAAFSRAWRMGINITEVFCVEPEQLKHELGLPKGSFMVYGKREYFSPTIEIAIGVTSDGAIMAGPPDAIKANCTKFALVVQGNSKTSDIAKKIKRMFGGDLDEIVRALPPGTGKLIGG
ncbi:DUF814 domain-containing protein [Candidatus Woesearchaeota archaeon]|nr:DUF814 domain-containing protein [Candidatus Woesearchaeota archaeon]MBW3017899.1 DUF814 domain-containing protein [Candidatus Woesearchaeota archaeon]